MTTFAGQYGPEPAFNPFGRALENTPFTVTIPTTGVLATLYTDRTKASTTPNPTATDAFGNITFFAAPGQYIVTLNGTSVEVSVYPDPSEPLGGITPVPYNVVSSSWPARPIVSQLAAGFAMYVSAVSTAGNPTDMQIGDTLFIPTTSSAPSFTASSPPGGIQSTAYSYTFAASNNPTSYAVASGTIPAGLTFNTSTGVLSGTPTTAATYTFTISATNNSGTTNAAQSSVTIAASGGATTLTLNNTAANWTYTDHATTIAADSVNQHNATDTVKATTNGTSGVQSYSAVGFVITSLSPNTAYTLDTLFGISVTGIANRKMYSTIIWQTTGGASNISSVTSASFNLTNAWQAFPAITNVVSPATTAQATIIVTYQSTDGSNLPNSEVFNWSKT